MLKVGKLYCLLKDRWPNICLDNPSYVKGDVFLVAKAENFYHNDQKFSDYILLAPDGKTLKVGWSKNFEHCLFEEVKEI